ncbi:MAG: hypothetical protein AAFU53_15625, partial [Cyanobacteria bacterium J06632_3]
MFKKSVIAGTVCLLSVIASTPAKAEGSAQWGLNQPLLEFDTVPINTTETRISSASRSLYVDILSAGEVINVSVCGANNSDTITMQIFETIPNAVDPAFTPTTSTQLGTTTSFTSNV